MSDETTSLSRQERRVLSAVKAAQPLAYSNAIADILKRDHPGWLTRLWPALGELFPPTVYPALMKLEQEGFVTSEWSQETFPERGNRRRRYYFPTEKGQSE